MRIGVIGGFQNGKSTFINCLLGGKYARTGGDGISASTANTLYKYNSINRITTTKDQTELSYQNFIEGKFDSSITEICFESNSPILKHIELIDTPGFNANKQDTQTAINSIRDLDIAFVIINNKGISSIELNIIHELERQNIPYYIFMNCLMQQGPETWNPSSKFNLKIANEIEALLENNHLSPMTLAGKKINIVNFIWYWIDKSNLRYETKEKRKELINIVKLYQMEEKHINFYIESQMEPILRLLLIPINLVPLHIFTEINKSFNKGLDKVFSICDSKTSSIKQLLENN